MTFSPSPVRPLAVAAIVCSMAGPALAADILVPADFPTPQAAINASEDGDVVILAPGTYPRFNTVGRAITIRSEDPSDPAVVASTIIDAEGEGPAITLIFGERRDTIIEGLTITGGLNSTGGGIAMVGSDPTIRDCVITGNEATTEGGGIYALQSSPRFERCLITENTAPRGGGAATSLTQFMQFEACTFSRNTATGDGGGVVHSGGGFVLRLTRCTFFGNTAGGNGGALAFNNGSSEVDGCLIYDNDALVGGAISWFDIGGRVYHSTIVSNTARSDGGAFWGFRVQPLIRNSIVRDNGPNPTGGFSSELVIEYSNFEGGGGEGTIDVDPQFVDPANDDFRILPSSPSANTGFNGWLPSAAIDDLDGDARIQDGTVDMGAYESAGTLPELSPVRGSLVMAAKNDFQILFGFDLPIAIYDPDTGVWSEFLRNMPAFAITADPEEQCFWIHNGESFTLGRIPYDTRRLEEVAVMRFEGQISASMSGMAVRDGTLYGVNMFRSIAQPTGLFEIDKQSGVAELLHEFSSDYLVTDLFYDEATDRMLFLSTAETIPPGDGLGIFEIDLETFEITPVQPWFNLNPFAEPGALQGLALGAGRNWIFRSQLNKLESWDSDALTLVETLSLPEWYPGGEFGLILTGLTWEPFFSQTPCPGDLNGDGAVDAADLSVLIGSFGQAVAPGTGADFNGDGIVDAADLSVLIGAFGSSC